MWFCAPKHRAVSTPAPLALPPSSSPRCCRRKRPQAGPQNLFVSLRNEKRVGTKICSATAVCQVLFPWNPAESSQQFNEGSPVIPIGQISKLSLRGSQTCLPVTGLVNMKACCNASAGAGIRRSQRAAVGNRGFGVSASLLTKINFPRTGTLSTHSTLSTQSRIWHEVGCRISS